MTKRAFTLLELILAMVVLAVLSAAVLPTTKNLVKRQKEMELKRALLEVRTAIDRFKKAVDEGLITVRDKDQMGYPADFEELVSGAPVAKDPSVNLRFLRKVPVDPMTGQAEWGMRSAQDDPETTAWGRENLFDIYSLSDGYALDETEYATW